jgi:hypothetical protein
MTLIGYTMMGEQAGPTPLVPSSAHGEVWAWD